MMFVAACSLLFVQGLKVGPGICIKVESGTTLDISGGNLMLESDLTGDASLIDLGSVTCNGGGEANNTTQYIPSGQGFFIRADGGVGMLTLENDDRTHGGQAFYKSGEENQMLVLKATGKVFKTGYGFFIKIKQVASVFENYG